MAARKPTRQSKDPTEMLQYLVKCTDGDFIFEVPAFWKVTFAEVNPARQSGMERGPRAHCIRIWEGEALRAVFCNCIGLRDLSVPVARKVVKTESKSEYESDSLGNFSSSSSRKLID